MEKFTFDGNHDDINSEYIYKNSKNLKDKIDSLQV